MNTFIDGMIVFDDDAYEDAYLAAYAVLEEGWVTVSVTTVLIPEEISTSANAAALVACRPHHAKLTVAAAAVEIHTKMADRMAKMADCMAQELADEVVTNASFDVQKQATKYRTDLTYEIEHLYDYKFPYTAHKGIPLCATLEKETLIKLCGQERDGSCRHYTANRGRKYRLTPALVFYLSTASLHRPARHEEQLGFNMDTAEDDPEFYRFLISTATNLVLMIDELSRKDTSFLEQLLRFAVPLRFDNLYFDGSEPLGSYGDKMYRKKAKYFRDFHTVRGSINICGNETKRFCRCMDKKRLEAKTMEKTGVCFGCFADFPRKKLHFCSGCLQHQYCSTKCSKDSWSSRVLACYHTEECPKLNFRRCEGCKILLTAKQMSQHECCRQSHHLLQKKTESSLEINNSGCCRPVATESRDDESSSIGGDEDSLRPVQEEVRYEQQQQQPQQQCLVEDDNVTTTNKETLTNTAPTDDSIRTTNTVDAVDGYTHNDSFFPLRENITTNQGYLHYSRTFFFLGEQTNCYDLFS